MSTKRPYQLPEPLICETDVNLDYALVKRFIDKHASRMQRYKYLEEMYKGFHSIYQQPDKPDWKPDNRLAINYPRYITETFLGYAYGIPIKEGHPDETVDAAMREFQNENELSDHEYELFQDVCIYGHAFEYLYQDEEAKTRMTVCTPKELFIVYDDTVRNRALFAVRYAVHEIEGSQGELFGEVLTRDQIIRFDKGNFTETLDNPYGLIPVVEYLMNRQRLGLYENVTGLIEAYNRAIGEKANDVDAFAEAYMKLIGVDIDDEEVKRIRENRIINLPIYGDTTGTQVDFMAKPTADSTQENLLDRLDRQIYQISMVANISDESFGNASSGTALAYKLQAMSNLASGFDRKIEKSLRKRYKIWSTLKTNVSDENAWKELQVTTSRNLPKNRLEEAQTAAQLSGIVSHETQLSLLSIVSDPKAELEKIEQEQEPQPLMDFDSHPSVTPEEEDSLEETEGGYGLQ